MVKKRKPLHIMEAFCLKLQLNKNNTNHDDFSYAPLYGLGIMPVALW